MTATEAAVEYFERLQWALKMTGGRNAGLWLAAMVTHVKDSADVDEEEARRVVLEVVKERDPAAPW